MARNEGSPRGRPRSLDADHAILEATLRLLAEQGFGAMSLEGVATEAGVGKTTIYRRYPGKIELVAAALSSLLSEAGPLPDVGNAKADLSVFLRQNLEVFVGGPVYPLVGTLLVQERQNPELFDIFRERVIFPRRARLREILERGVTRGEIRPEADLDAAMEALVGALYARHISGLPETPEWLESVIELVWLGLVARSE